MSQNALKHGMEGTPEYNAFYNARRRCVSPKSKDYANYGGRGMRFRFASFVVFYQELGPRPSPKHTLDRKNNDGHYESGNVRWATRTEQMQNQRKRTGCDSQAKFVSKTSGDKWRAVVPVNGKQKHLGSFPDEASAIDAVKEALRG